ncbi:hypothetical protein D3C81_1992200 [compost metagenome]
MQPGRNLLQPPLHQLPGQAEFIGQHLRGMGFLQMLRISFDHINRHGRVQLEQPGLNLLKLGKQPGKLRLAAHMADRMA